MTSLTVQNLSVARDGAMLLDDISFEATAGEFIGVVGPNGAGKSTLLRALAGVAHAEANKVIVNGAPVEKMAPRERARVIAYLPQLREVAWAITAEAVVSLGRFAYGAGARLGPADLAAVDAALAAADCQSFRNRVASTLSGGEQARIHLARALAAETPVLIADEPTAALDLKHALAILKTLRARADAGGIVIAALHDLALAQRFCTRLIILNRGRMVDDCPAETAITEEVLTHVFGVTAAELQLTTLEPKT